jgi:hypothetical protein
VGLKVCLDVLERESRLPLPEFEPRIVQPRSSPSTDNSVAVSLVPLKTQNYEIYINKIQRDATDAGIYLLQNYSTFFGCPSHPTSGVHKTMGTRNV